MWLFSAGYALFSVGLVIFFAQWTKGLHKRAIYKAFIFGLAFAPIAGYISFYVRGEFMGPAQNPFDAQLNLILLYFFIVAPIEELAKFFAAFIPVLQKEELKTSTDGIILGITAALGFACIENVLYLTKYGVAATLPRLLLGNLGHAAYSSLWGYSMGVTLTEDAPLSLLVTLFAAASFLHGLYNLLLTYNILSAIIAFALSIGLWILMFYLLQGEKKRHRNKK